MHARTHNACVVSAQRQTVQVHIRQTAKRGGLRLPGRASPNTCVLFLFPADALFLHGLPPSSVSELWSTLLAPSLAAFALVTSAASSIRSPSLLSCTQPVAVPASWLPPSESMHIDHMISGCGHTPTGDGWVTTGLPASSLPSCLRVACATAPGLALSQVIDLRPFGLSRRVCCPPHVAGTGVVGIALALEGCRSSILTDLPHITTLTLLNVTANCGSCHAQQYPKVLPHRWGTSADDVITANSGSRPDLITGADIIFDPQYHGDLLLSLRQLSAPHTVTYLAHRLRHAVEQGFVEKACAHGFAVEVVPDAHLHEDYCHGDYQLLRLCLQDMMEE